MSKYGNAIAALDSLPEGSQERFNAAKGIADQALAKSGYSRSERRRLITQVQTELAAQAEQDAETLRASVREYLEH